MTTVLDVLSALLMLMGAALVFAAALGVLRFPDVLMRMHAATKPQSLGVMLFLLAAALQVRSDVAVAMLLLAGVFQLLTAPVAAHLVARIAYRGRHSRTDLLLVDELDPSRPDGAAPGTSHGGHGPPEG